MTALAWQQARVRCYGQLGSKELASLVCLWPPVFGPWPVRIVLARQPGAPDGYELAVVTTDLGAGPAELVERYATRWNVEVLFEEARQIAGVGQARNRTPRAVGRTVPFSLLCHVCLCLCRSRQRLPRSGRTAQWQLLVPESWKEPPCAGRKRQL
jgi:hypothetical protein